jgi:hydrogenase maturation protein HypF
MILDWEPAIRELLDHLGRKEASGTASAKFHNMLVEMILAVARKVGVEKIVLTGGCFQNRYLIEQAVERLRQENFKPHWHQRVPSNDGGIALGQAVAATWGVASGGHAEFFQTEK